MAEEDPTKSFRPTGAGSALAAAALFGIGTPLAKLLLGEIAPLVLAALLYLGMGVGLSLFLLIRRGGRATEAPLLKRDIPKLSAALLFGGVLGPALLMFGLRSAHASTTSLLLNLESVFTVLLAWFVFHEHFDRRIALGMASILAGGVLLGLPGAGGRIDPTSVLAVTGACLCWSIDNNVTQMISAGDPVRIGAFKGLAAGTANLIIALLLGASIPPIATAAGALAVGTACYGISVALFILALRGIGTARTSAYFSLAPFIGAAASILLLEEPVGIGFAAAGALMAAGAWLHLTERHVHEHEHEPLVHAHAHLHDEHHRHAHEEEIDPARSHAHEHAHEPMRHTHRHFPDIHHRHRHDG